MEPKSVWRPQSDALGSVQPQLRVIRLKLRSFIAPRVELTFEPSTRSPLPLSYVRQSIMLAALLREPRAIVSCVEPTNARYGLIGVIEARVVPALWGLMCGVLQEYFIDLVR